MDSKYKYGIKNKENIQPKRDQEQENVTYL